MVNCEAIPLEQTAPEGTLGFLGVASKTSAKQLNGAAAEALLNITEVVDQMLVLALEQRNREAFHKVRQQLFPNYVYALRAASALVCAVAPKVVLHRIAYESFSVLESDLRNEGLARFGSSVRDQAVFTVWTLRRIQTIITKILEADPLAADLKAKDAEHAANFSFHMEWTHFHLNCLIAAIHFDKPVYPEVRDEITQGLRAAVNAYGWIRQVMDLRIPQQEPEISDVVWDEEDQELVSASMRDLDSEDDE